MPKFSVEFSLACVGDMKSRGAKSIKRKYNMAVHVTVLPLDSIMGWIY